MMNVVHVSRPFVTSAILAWLSIALFLLSTQAAGAPPVLHVDHRGAQSPWADAYACIQDALADAAPIAESGPVEIWVAAGVYKPDQGVNQTPGDRDATFRLINNVAIYGGFAGGETRRYQRDWTLNETMLSGDLAGDDRPRDCGDYSDCCIEHDGRSCDNAACQEIVCEHLPECCNPHWDEWEILCANRARYYCAEQFYGSGDNSYHVVTSSGTDTSAVLDGFTVSGGYPEGEGIFAGYGPGLLNDGGTPTIARCTFRDHIALHGGGIYTRNEGNLTVTDCVFTKNFSSSNGSAVRARDSDIVLEGCRFTDNGGSRAVQSDFARSTTLTDCTFINNAGGGARIMGDLTATDCLFIGAPASAAAGLEAMDGHAEVTNCTFIGGFGSTTAGMNVYEGSAAVSNCMFIGNRGSAFSCFYAGATLNNCVFTGNWRESLPAVRVGAGYLKLMNCTVTYNTSDSHAAVDAWELSTLIITNSILWGNTKKSEGGEIAQIGASDSTVRINHSCIEGWTGALGGTGNTGDDPMLIDPAGPDGIFGTEDDNLRLGSGSPAINAGDTSALPPGLVEDLDGYPRVGGLAVDMGAYEGARASFLLSAGTLTIPEGGTASFTVALDMDPIDPVEVSVIAQSGDPDITVLSGGTLSFDTNDYSIPQSVTLAAAEDIGFTNGRMAIHVIGSGITLGHLTAVEADNQPIPLVVYVDSNAQGAALGTNWDDAFTEVQDALDAASDLGDISEIWVADGIYRPSARTNPLWHRTTTFQLVDGVAVYGGFAGWETSLDQRRPRENMTVLSGDLNADDGIGVIRADDNAYNVVLTADTGPGTRLDGFMITAAIFGGLHNASSSTGLTVANCVFAANRGWDGGGLHNYGSDLALVNSIFSGNIASAGAGVYSDRRSSVTLTNTVFTGNTNTGHDGAGGMSVAYDGTAVLTGCVFSNNRSTYGVAGFTSGAGGTLANCIFRGNESGRYGRSELAQINYGTNAPSIDYSSVQGWSGLAGGIGNTGADPLFVDALGPDGIAGTLDDDLRLSLDSPLINAGDPGLVTELDATDLDGNPRIQGCRVDMGPYESDVTQALGDFDGNENLNLADIAGFQLCMGMSAPFFATGEGRVAARLTDWIVGPTEIVGPTGRVARIFRRGGLDSSERMTSPRSEDLGHPGNPAWLDACLCAFDYDDNSQIDLADFTAFHEAFVNP